jgi:predicted lactoylglutathione lyase
LGSEIRRGISRDPGGLLFAARGWAPGHRARLRRAWAGSRRPFAIPANRHCRGAHNKLWLLQSTRTNRTVRKKVTFMQSKQSRKIFVNLPVADLKRSMDFFTKLGFTYNPKFTDDNAACMILSEDGYVMLLKESFFKGFTKKSLCDTRTYTEGLFALSCTSRAEVDDMVKTALSAGGAPAMPPQDHGFMYGHSFYDPDGHHWEVIWMDPAAAQ